MKTKGFTLIELLVVIAIIALLMAIIMPSLNLARKKARATACLANVKNLSLGWYMYMGDNDGKIMSSEDEAGGTDGTGAFIGWIGIPRDIYQKQMSISQTSPEVTNQDEIRGIEQGMLFPYVKNPSVYHCPADNVRKSLYDQSTVYVSYSIPHCLNGYPDPGSSMYKNQIRRFDEIRNPATAYVFVEAAETRNWNSGHHFVIGAPEYGHAQWGWWGPIAINHGDSSILGFSDGHGETRKWRDQYTIERVDKLLTQGGTNYGVDVPPEGQTQDIQYMAKGWAYRHND